MTVEGRCPLDPNAKHAWAPGDLDKMFTKLTSEPYLSEYEVEILSSPHWDESETNLKATNGKGLPWIITMENVVTEEEALRLIELGAVEGYQRSAEYVTESESIYPLAFLMAVKFVVRGTETKRASSLTRNAFLFCRYPSKNHHTLVSVRESQMAPLKKR
jgi:hypothetical protein